MYKNGIKRIVDFLIALTAIVCLLPVLLVITLFLHFANKGAGTFFVQERPGLHGKIFKMVKYKTMRDAFDQEGKPLPDKDRLTRVGRVVRSLSIDELPQLWNVLRGDMSLIGPRPLLVKYLPLYTPEQMRRHEVRPGITGWAQVNGRNAITHTQKFVYDVWYVDNVSLRLDLKILWLTVKNVVKRKGISSAGEVTAETFNGYN